MRKWDRKLDLISYSVAISACERGAKWQLSFELIKDIERNAWHTAAAAQEWTEGATFEASRAAFEEALDGPDLSDNCECEPDSVDYTPCARARARKRPRNKPPAHVHEPKRPRNSAMPANAVIIDLTGDAE